MNNLWAIGVVTGLFMASGWHLTYMLKESGRVERLGLSLLLGAGLTTLLWFMGYRLGLPLSLGMFVLACGVTFGIGYVVVKLLNLVPNQKSEKLNKVEKWLGVTVIAALVVAFLIGNYNPLTAWDSLALYDFVGHAIATDADLRFIDYGSYYLSYPLMISLVHAAVYLLGGVSAQGMHAVLFAAFIGIIYGRMRTWSNPRYALIACLLVIGQNEIFAHATFAYTNLPYISYLIAGFLYAVSGGTYSLLLAGLLLGLSSWVRSSEIFWIIGVILIAWQGWIGGKKIMAALATFMLLAIRAIWSTFQSSVFQSLGVVEGSAVKQVSVAALVASLANWQEVYSYLYLYIIWPYLRLWLLCIPILYIAFMRHNRKLLMLGFAMLMSGGAVLGGIMVFSTYYESWNQIGDSARRMVLFIVPLSLITATYALYVANQKVVHEK
jgi:hypothetical protein